MEDDLQVFTAIAHKLLANGPQNQWYTRYALQGAALPGSVAWGAIVFFGPADDLQVLVLGGEDDQAVAMAQAAVQCRLEPKRAPGPYVNVVPSNDAQVIAHQSQALEDAAAFMHDRELPVALLVFMRSPGQEENTIGYWYPKMLVPPDHLLHALQDVLKRCYQL